VRLPGVRTSPWKIGPKAGVKAVACQSIQRSASARTFGSAGQS
jgi:hypothetical protein